MGNREGNMSKLSKQDMLALPVELVALSLLLHHQQQVSLPVGKRDGRFPS